MSHRFYRFLRRALSREVGPPLRRFTPVSEWCRSGVGAVSELCRSRAKKDWVDRIFAAELAPNGMAKLAVVQGADAASGSEAAYRRSACRGAEVRVARGSPALAGIELVHPARLQRRGRLPRARGDRPFPGGEATPLPMCSRTKGTSGEGPGAAETFTSRGVVNRERENPHLGCLRGLQRRGFERIVSCFV